MRSTVTTLLTVLTILIVPVTAASQPLSLSVDAAVALGLQNSKPLHASLMKAEYADAKSSEASVQRLAKIQFGGTYTRLSDVPPASLSIPKDIFGPGLPPTNISSVLSPTIVDNYNLKLTLQQPIFTGWRLQSNASLADYSARAAGEDFRADRADLVYGIKTAYWNLFKAIESRKVVDETVSMMQAHAKDIRNFFEQGLVTKNEVLKVDVQLSNTQVLQLDASNNVRLARLALNNTLGIPLTTDITLTDTAEHRSTSDSGAVDALIDRAIGSRPEMKGMEYRVKAGESAVTLARSGWFPQIYLVGDYLYARPNSRIFPTRDRFDNTWDVSIALSLDIWNWGTTIHQTHQAQAQLMQAQDGLAQVRDGITLEVTQNYLNYRTAGERITVAEQGVTQAVENYRITDEKFKSGLALNTDLLDAEVALLQARWNLIQALVDHQLADARLRKAVGEEAPTQ